MKKILYVILHTCTRPDRHEGIVNSWGKDVDYLFYSDCTDPDKKILQVSTDNTYSSNEPKHVSVIKHIIENDFQYEWFFFCDDDTFVNTKKVENEFHIFDETKINGSVLDGTWEKDRTLKYCSGGAGYLIKKELLSKISESIKSGSSGYSDVTLGLCAKELGIEFSNIEGFNSQNPKFYTRENETIKDMFTYHYINSDLMVDMYNIINT